MCVFHYVHLLYTTQPRAHLTTFPRSRQTISKAQMMSIGEAGELMKVVQSNLPKWIPLNWITHLNGYHLYGPI